MKKALELLSSALLFFVIMVIFWQIFSRYALNNPSSFTEELARFGLIWLGFSSATYAFTQKSHVGIDLISAKVSDKNKQKIALLSYISVALFALIVLFIGGANLVWITLSLGQTSAILKIPMGVVYLIAPISGILIFAVAASDAFQSLKHFKTD